jgi:hypothetical protein
VVAFLGQIAEPQFLYQRDDVLGIPFRVLSLHGARDGVGNPDDRLATRCFEVVFELRKQDPAIDEVLNLGRIPIILCVGITFVDRQLLAADLGEVHYQGTKATCSASFLITRQNLPCDGSPNIDA